VVQLSQQVASLEEELESRDSLLEDIKAETFKSAETLRMAAKVNQVGGAVNRLQRSKEAALFDTCFGA
jgi:hypothetical protein